MADPRDIEARLRSYSVADGGNGCEPPRVALEAADEIARLRADFLRYAVHHAHFNCANRCTCGLDAARARCGGGA